MKKRQSSQNPYAPPEQDLDAAPAPGPAFTGERDETRPGVVRYRYVVRRGQTVLGLLIVSGALAFYTYKTLTNDRGLIINGVIELGQGGATVFWGTFAVLLGLVELLIISVLVEHFGPPKYLEMDDAALTIPPRVLRKVRVIPYSTIEDIQLVVVQSQTMLRVTTAGGQVNVPAVLLASDAQLREVADQLVARARGKGTHQR